MGTKKPETTKYIKLEGTIKKVTYTYTQERYFVFIDGKINADMTVIVSFLCHEKNTYQSNQGSKWFLLAYSCRPA